MGRGEGVCLDYKNQTLFPEYELTVERSDQNHSRWKEKLAEAVGFSLHFVVQEMYSDKVICTLNFDTLIRQY